MANVAPLGMYTPGWDWLNNLQVGDLVDCCDERHTWYKAHVSDTRLVEHEDCLGNKIKKVKIAFRYHDDDFGLKADPNNPEKKYVGWLSKYDSWRASTCASIYPLNTMVTPYC